MKTNLHQWKEIIKHEKKKLAISVFFFLIGGALYLLSGNYVKDNLRNVVAPDLILDHIGPYNLNFIFVWLYLLVILIYFAYPLIFKPKDLPYFINMFALFLVIRSGFVLFTHLRVPYDAVTAQFPGYLQLLDFSNDLFFSGHTGLTFLAFLMLRHESKWLGYFMFASSIILGITVLLMHVHYSIDVFSAFFITYGIYKIGNRFISR